MDVEQLKDEVRQGRIEPERLVDLLAKLAGELQCAKEQNEELQAKLRELEKKLGGAAGKVDQPFSVRAEEQRQAARGKKPRKGKKKRRRGRRSTAEKLAGAARTEKVFPDDVAEEDCWLSHTRPVWRLENNQAVLVAYEVYRGPGNRYGKIPGALGRSEFGSEVVLAIAYQVYVVGLSLDKVCLVMNFFQGLRLRKSQIDALVNLLARHWEGEFEVLCTLLANSAVVHADETGWSINSVWAFLSEKVRVLFFGVNKDAETLRQILDPDTFSGIVISDDAAVYAQFTHSQKCWAHLLRKAIKLTLLDPANETYRELADRLLEIYRAACRLKADRRYGDEGRAEKVDQLDDEILALCYDTWVAELPPSEGPENDYRLLCNELMRLNLNRELFAFVTAPAVQSPSGETVQVSGTNNEAERTLRSAAEARKTGRTSKTPRGARRRTVIVSVLESLRRQLSTFTLSSVIAEIRRWHKRGRSCFTDLLRRLKLPPPGASTLDALLPASGE